MSQKVVDYLAVFGSDERFAVFALASILVAAALVPLMRGAGRMTILFSVAAALLLFFSFVVLAPLSALSLAPASAHLNPVGLSFNCGFLALGIALALKFFRQTSFSK
jgi:predicted phage tail protein